MFRPLVILAVGSLIVSCLPAASAQEVDFATQVRPLLSDRCYACHGPDEAARTSGIRLDTPEGIAEVNDSIVERIFSDDESELMPPAESKLVLNEAERQLIRNWIEQGAVWQPHWAFVPPAKPEPPGDANGWTVNKIDRFVLARMREHSLAPSPPATREKLIRRLTFDITGLPPTLEEIDAFLADESPDAYEKLVDRLLVRKHYGERMASEWLDVARYSDSYGMQVDRDRFVWPWRDWVIEAFNANMPYDQFITEQLAGDLLPDATQQQQLATTFNRLHSQEAEGGSILEEFRVEYVADRTHTMATAFMGLTLECARCHDHKFDPISQEEYYRLFAYFNNINEAGLYSFFTQSIPTPTLVLYKPGQREQIAATEQKIATLEASLQEVARSEMNEGFVEWFNEGHVDAEKTQLTRALIREVDFATVEIVGNERITTADGRPAVRLSGDDEIKLDVGNFTRDQPFTVSLRMRIPEHRERAVVFHRSRAWTDAGSRGYELLLVDGHLQFSLVHFLPDNAAIIRTERPLPTNEWMHLTVSHDGSGRAAGLRIFINGEDEPIAIIHDRLTKNITGGGAAGDHIAIGARFRDRGFADGEISDFRVYQAALCPLEVKSLVRDEPVDELTTRLMQREQGGDYPYIASLYLTNFSEAHQKAHAELQAARKELFESQNSLTEIMGMRDMPDRRTSYVLRRGAYDQRRQLVAPGTPEVLGTQPALQSGDRLELANWLTRNDHPLTARVTVNRYWQLFFGEGLVRTPEDFGSQGATPTHPQLLDWLAVDFAENGWNLKRLIKQIVMSATYRQGSVVTDQMLNLDPDNHWLARFPANRLPAEMIRDNALAVSGLLVDKIGGPPAKPYQVAASFKPVTPDSGEGLYRRSLYTYWKRTGPAPVLTTFDAARRDVCRVQRERTSSPLQSLVLLNDPQMIEAARVLAERLIHEHGDANGNERLQTMFRLLTSRLATDEELEVLINLFEKQLAYFTTAPERAQEYLSVGERVADQSLNAAELAALASVANTLFNFDEVVFGR